MRGRHIFLGGEGLQVLSQILASVHEPQRLNLLHKDQESAQGPALEKFNLAEEDRRTEITQRQGSLRAHANGAQNAVGRGRGSFPWAMSVDVLPSSWFQDPSFSENEAKRRLQ